MVTEDEITLEAVNYMSNELPEDRGCDDAGLPVQTASVRLLAHLWESRAEAAASTARQVPLVASKRSGRALERRPTFHGSRAGLAGVGPTVHGSVPAESHFGRPVRWF